MFQISIFAFFLSFGALAQSPARPDGCRTRVRAVFDVGSGSTKMNLSQVEICAEKIRVIRVLDEDSSVDVPLEASKDKDENISEHGMELAIAALKSLKDKAVSLTKEFGEDQLDLAAAGTHAFRTAKNQAVLQKRIATLGISIVPLTQEQEAFAGMSGAQGIACPDDSPLMVWDVGGGSQQWTIATFRPQFKGLPIGAESFKKTLIERLKLKNPALCEVSGATPNPIGQDNLEIGILAAKKIATQIPQEFKTGKFCVIGIGGVHNKAIEAQILKQWPKISSCVCKDAKCPHYPGTYSRRELSCLTYAMVEKNDCDEGIKGPYSTTAVSNLLLVSGLMSALKIDEIHTENVNMGHGLIIDRKLLKFKTHAIEQSGL